jgi:hypothetical protein
MNPDREVQVFDWIVTAECRMSTLCILCRTRKRRHTEEQDKSMHHSSNAYGVRRVRRMNVDTYMDERVQREDRFLCNYIAI